jgi:hypothetical protein
MGKKGVAHHYNQAYNFVRSTENFLFPGFSLPELS